MVVTAFLPLGSGRSYWQEVNKSCLHPYLQLKKLVAYALLLGIGDVKIALYCANKTGNVVLGNTADGQMLLKTSNHILD